MRRKITLRAGQTQRVATASAVLLRGVEEPTGQVLGQREVAERVGWAADLVQQMATRLLAAHWNAVDVARLASGRDHTGRPLPSTAYTALRRLGWTIAPPPGIQVNDRVVRVAQEAAGRLLRSAAWRAELLAAVLATWPKNPTKRTSAEWDALRAAVPNGGAVATGVLRARTRQVAEFIQRHQRPPKDLFELEAPPRAPRQLLLAACDHQQATIVRCQDDPDRFAVLRVQLPVRPDARSYQDWTWVVMRFTLPPTVPPDAALHLPTIRTTKGKACGDVTFTHAVPAASCTGHIVALGVDWGVNVLLAAGSVRLVQDADGRRSGTTDGRTVMFRAGGILAKADRVRRAGEVVSAKVNQHAALINGRAARGLTEGAVLRAKHDLLAAERDRIARRRRHLNTALANATAAWLVKHARAAQASVIYFEDLRDLEARGKSRNLNTRLSQTVRSQILTATRHAAAKHGIAVVVVPARETSRRCPRCLTVLKHAKAPDRPAERGWKWAICPKCGYTGDRDAGAWQRIASRGLLHQQKTFHDRTSGQLRVRGVDPERMPARAFSSVSPPPESIDQGSDRPSGDPVPAVCPGSDTRRPPRTDSVSLIGADSVRRDARPRAGVTASRHVGTRPRH